MINRNPTMSAYLRSIRRYDTLSREDEHQLAVRARKGDMEARQRLITSNLRLVVSLATRHNARYDDQITLDLIQEGTVGLVHAVDNFNPSSGHRLSTYAVPWISHFISLSVSELTHPIHLPAYTQRLVRQIRHFAHDFETTHERQPSDHEIAEALHARPSTVRLAIEATTATDELPPEVA